MYLGNPNDLQVGRVETGSPETDALNQQILQKRLETLEPGSEEHRRIAEVLATYTKESRTPSAGTPDLRPLPAPRSSR